MDYSTMTTTQLAEIGVAIQLRMAADQKALDNVTAAIRLKEQESQIQWGERFEIMTKERKFRGHIYPSKATGTFARIGKRPDGKRCIHLTGAVYTQSVDRVFVEGDRAEYHSFNLHYMGVIKSITDKRINIVKDNYQGKVKSLDLNEFAWRNHDLDLQRIADENAETSMYI